MLRFQDRHANTKPESEVPQVNTDEVILAETGLIQLLRGFQATHQANINNTNAPVVAAEDALTAAQAAVVTAQATLDAATAQAQATVTSETAVIAEDQQAIDAANAVIVSLGGTPV